MPPKTTTTPAPTCCVCFEKFNQTIRSPTTCPHCQIQICRGCFQTYLLGETTDVPRCVNPSCDRGWERNFLDGEMTSTFRLKTYKEHREKVLADREKSRLPTVQDDASAVLFAKAEQPKHLDKLNELSAQIAELTRERDKLGTNLWHLGRVIESHGRYRMPENTSETVGTQAINLSSTSTITPRSQPAAVFIKPCPAPDCKGFLSTAWKCGLCNLYTCNNCHVLKGPERENPDHHCNPDDVATAELINREAKSCPKCGVSICKIEGCDQMWCTNCNTGFNWKTGKEIQNNAIHNPHYFDWLRSQGRDPTQNTPQQNCGWRMDRQITVAIYGTGGSYGYVDRRRYLRMTREEKEDWFLKEYLQEAYRLGREVEDNERNNDINNTEEELRVLRVRYMIGDLTEDDWKIALQKSEKDRRVRIAKTQINQVFSSGIGEIMQRLLEDGHDRLAIKQQIDDLVKYCNRCFAELSLQFNRKMKPIDIQERRIKPVIEPSKSESSTFPEGHPLRND